MSIFWVYMFIFLILSFVCSTLKWLKGGGQEVNLTEDWTQILCTKSLLSVFSSCKTSCSCNTELTAPQLKVKGQALTQGSISHSTSKYWIQVPLPFLKHFLQPGTCFQPHTSAEMQDNSSFPLAFYKRVKCKLVCTLSLHISRTTWVNFANGIVPSTSGWLKCHLCKNKKK